MKTEKRDPWWMLVLPFICIIAVTIADVVAEIGKAIFNRLAGFAESKPKWAAGTMMVLTILAIIGWWPHGGPSPEKPSGEVTKQSMPAEQGPVTEAQFKQYLNKLQKKYGSSALKGQTVFLNAGHGGRAPRTEHGLDVGTQWTIQGVTVYEATVTYRSTEELRQMVNALGGRAVLINTAPSATMLTGPREMPLPKDAILSGGQAFPNDSEGRRLVVQKTDQLASKYGGYPVFLSLHVDAIGSAGWSGMKAWHRRGENSRLATLMAESMHGADRDYGRSQYGRPKPCIGEKNWDVLMNGISESDLLEFGVPVESKTTHWSDPDSWWLRYGPSRWAALDQVVIASLVRLNREQ